MEDSQASTPLHFSLQARTFSPIYLMRHYSALTKRCLGDHVRFKPFFPDSQPYSLPLGY